MSLQRVFKRLRGTAVLFQEALWHRSEGFGTSRVQVPFCSLKICSLPLSHSQSRRESLGVSLPSPQLCLSQLLCLLQLNKFVWLLAILYCGFYSLNVFLRYQVDYQIGVFISRSSVNIFPFKNLWFLAALQVFVLVDVLFIRYLCCGVLYCLWIIPMC